MRRVAFGQDTEGIRIVVLFSQNPGDAPAPNPDTEGTRVFGMLAGPRVESLHWVDETTGSSLRRRPEVDDACWAVQNRRRAALLRKRINQRLSSRESNELSALQREAALRAKRTAAPDSSHLDDLIARLSARN